MLEAMQKINEDIVISPYIKWALDPQCPQELRELSKRTVIGYTLCMSSLRKISSFEYSQIMHELNNGEEE